MKYTNAIRVCVIIAIFTMLLYGIQSPSVSGGDSSNTVTAPLKKYEARYSVVVIPLQNNSNEPSAGQSADDLFRSGLIKTRYFHVVEREETYETVMEFVPEGYGYIGGERDNDTYKLNKQAGTPEERWKVKHKGDAGWLDIPFRIERHNIVKFTGKLDADFAVSGKINQFGAKMRVDIELIEARHDRTLASLTAEAEGFEQFPDIINSLTHDITNACRRFNAERDADFIASSYKQGLYTYETTVQQLKELSSAVPDSFAPPVTLLSIYLERPDMEDEIIPLGERILNIFDPKCDEHLRVLQTMGIDPFDELAKAYETRGNIDKVIDIRSKAINVSPVNTLTHFKKLALAYKGKGMEQQHIEVLQKALNTYKTDPEIYFHLGAAMERAGRHAQALHYYRKSLKYSVDAKQTAEVRSRISQLE